MPRYISEGKSCQYLHRQQITNSFAIGFGGVDGRLLPLVAAGFKTPALSRLTISALVPPLLPSAPLMLMLTPRPMTATLLVLRLRSLPESPTSLRSGLRLFPLLLRCPGGGAGCRRCGSDIDSCCC